MYVLMDSSQFAVRFLLQSTKCESIGRAMAAQSARPHHPVIIVPGLASSALEVWESSTTPSWVGDRLWLDIPKVGQAAKVKSFVDSISRKRSNTANDSGDAGMRLFLKHLSLADDGYSDPPGIRVRPAAGISAVDYLYYSAIDSLKTASYVMAFVIRALIEVGYDRRSLYAAPYDWRIPLSKLEERDGYFSELKHHIRLMHDTNNKVPVLLIGHSMGCRVVQMFIEWMRCKGPKGDEWLERYVYGFAAVGAPILGAGKALRGLLTGDPLGLDLFLTLRESRELSQHLGSLPSLLPLRHADFAAPIAWLRNAGSSVSSSSSSLLPLVDMRVWASVASIISGSNSNLPTANAAPTSTATTTTNNASTLENTTQSTSGVLDPTPTESTVAASPRLVTSASATSIANTTTTTTTTTTTSTTATKRVRSNSALSTPNLMAEHGIPLELIDENSPAMALLSNWAMYADPSTSHLHVKGILKSYRELESLGGSQIRTLLRDLQAGNDDLLHMTITVRNSATPLRFLKLTPQLLRGFWRLVVERSQPYELITKAAKQETLASRASFRDLHESFIRKFTPVTDGLKIKSFTEQRLLNNEFAYFHCSSPHDSPLFGPCEHSLFLCDRWKTLVLFSYLPHGVSAQSFRILSQEADPRSLVDSQLIDGLQLHEITTYFNYGAKSYTTCSRVYRKVPRESLFTENQDNHLMLAQLHDTLPTDDEPSQVWENVRDEQMVFLPREISLFGQYHRMLDTDRFRAVNGTAIPRSTGIPVDADLFVGSFKLDKKLSHSMMPIFRVASVVGLKLRAAAALEEYDTTLRFKPTRHGLLMRKFVSGVCHLTCDAIFHRPFATSLGTLGSAEAALFFVEKGTCLALVVRTTTTTTTTNANTNANVRHSRIDCLSNRE